MTHRPATGRKKKATPPALSAAGAPPRKIAERLARAVVTPKIELHAANPWQLLIATILSAQSTDRTINRITPALFRRYSSPKELAASDPAELSELIKPSGFYRNKAVAIREASRVVAERFAGKVPQTMAELVQLPGVARKTANVVLGYAFGKAEGIVVDTHVARVALRLGLSYAKDPVKIEADLCTAFARSTWTPMGSRLLLHGRYVCTAKAPGCGRCPLNELCPSRQADAEGSWQARADAEWELVQELWQAR